VPRRIDRHDNILSWNQIYIYIYIEPNVLRRIKGVLRRKKGVDPRTTTKNHEPFTFGPVLEQR
jgi:hypothetical protein